MKAGNKKGDKMEKGTVGTFAAAVATAAFLGIAGAAGSADFSANIAMKNKLGSFTGKIFVAGDRARTERPEAVTITRMDKNSLWILMPEKKQYMDHSLRTQNLIFTGSKVPGETGRELLGRETVDGKKAGKYRVTVKSGEKAEQVLAWIQEGTGLPLKTEAEDGSWSASYGDIKTGKQDPALFELPAGYTQFSMGQHAPAGHGGK